jgi:tetratricopeptide (TPR) repeat protein
MLLALVLAAVMNGYVDDSTCASCHADRAKTYQHVGMAKSFYRPRAGMFIEDFDAPPYFHERSRQYFEMRRRGDEVIFRRWQVAADGTPVHLFEQKVDWILGSGHHSRTYLYATPGGELYQLPLSWYTATGEWRMAPGYDRPDHDGVVRRVRHECMFCHNAYPAAAPDRLSYWRPQTFPAQLPEGIGCQRCHGPGAKHVETGTRDTIVNPVRLGTKLRNDICYECHMQPTVIISGLRKFGRDIYSFRPGQALDDYAHRIDIDEEDLPRAERFEINHHPYRLEQSRCFTESEGRLSCLTCHDPHRKITGAAHYRKACMSCHQTPHRVTEDCTSCHMPKRRPQDVVHTVMTDHFIRRTPGGPELLAMREEREPAITRVESADELYDTVAFVRATGGANAALVQKLERLLRERKPAEIEPYLDLASAMLRHRRWQDLDGLTAAILAREPQQELALEWRAIARAALTRDTEEAIGVLSSLQRPEALFNAGVFLAGRGRTEEAMKLYERALAARPNLAAAWYRLGEAKRECGDDFGALIAFRRAAAIEPTHVRALEALRALGDDYATSPSPQAGTPAHPDSRGDRSSGSSAPR